MKSTWMHIGLLALLLILVAGALTQSGRPSATSDLDGTSWQLVKFQAGDGTILTPDDKSHYTIAFANDGRVSVRIDCNRGSGTWTSEESGQLQFKPLALTRAMCPPVPLNERIPKDWEYMRSYVLKGGHLFLSLMADAGTYEFEPIAQTNPATTVATISGLPATFAGTWPCGDCPALLYRLNLFPDHTFVSRTTYQGSTTQSDDRGSWEVTDETLVLNGQRGTPTKFLLHDLNTLEKLDVNGHEIPSKLKLNYELKRTTTFTPIEYSGKE